MTGQALTVARGVLLPALALATRVVERRSTIPILGNVLLRAGDGAVSITGTDLDIDITVSRRIGLDGGETAEVALPAASLHEIVRKLPEGADVRLAADGGGMWQVQAGRSRFRLPSLPVTDFPTLAAGEFSHGFVIDAAELRRMLETVSFSISTEETRFYLNGAHWHAEEDEAGPRLVMVATDGHRLAKTSTTLPAGAADMPGIIVPRKTVELMAKVLPDKGEVSVSLSAARIMVSAEDGEGGVALASKLIDGTFPDYRRVVPQGNPHHIGIDRATLAAAIGRVTTISTDRSHGVKFAFADGELKLTTRNPDTGDAEETLAVDGGETVEIGFNGRYCLDVLNAVAGETAVFELGDAGAPALVRAAGDCPSVFVLMPMRI